MGATGNTRFTAHFSHEFVTITVARSKFANRSKPTEICFDRSFPSNSTTGPQSITLQTRYANHRFPSIDPFFEFPFKMIHVLATIELVPGKRQEFLAHFHELMPLVHQEEGCLAYAPAVDLPTGIGAQIPQRPDVAVIVEQWESLATLEKHLVAPHMNAYRAKVKELVVSTKLQILEPA